MDKLIDEFIEELHSIVDIKKISEKQTQNSAPERNANTLTVNCTPLYYTNLLTIKYLLLQ